MTTKRTAAADEGVGDLTSSLADIVCWIVFYLQRCGPDELDLDVADSLLGLIGDALRKLPVPDRLAFLEHATNRAEGATIEEYESFLLDMAETLGLE